MKKKIAWSAICCGLVAGHYIWPKVNLDTPALVLLVLALLPWIAHLVQSLELPGGFKIVLKDVKEATDRVVKGRLSATASASKIEAKGALTNRQPEDTGSFLGGPGVDPNLALVALRIEIERRLRLLAAGLPRCGGEQGVGRLINELIRAERIDPQTVDGLRELIALGNQAAHGVAVDAAASRWARDMGPSVLAVLDELSGGSENAGSD